MESNIFPIAWAKKEVMKVQRRWRKNFLRDFEERILIFASHLSFLLLSALVSWLLSVIISSEKIERNFHGKLKTSLW